MSCFYFLCPPELYLIFSLTPALCSSSHWLPVTLMSQLPLYICGFIISDLLILKPTFHHLVSSSALSPCVCVSAFSTRWHALSPGEVHQLPYSSPSLPTVVPPLLSLRNAFAMFPFGDLYPWSFPIIAGAFWNSVEFPRLLQSLPVFPRVLQLLPEFLLPHRSSCFCAGVPASPLELLALRVLRRSFVRLPLSSKSFPIISYDIAIAS